MTGVLVVAGGGIVRAARAVLIVSRRWTARAGHRLVIWFSMGGVRTREVDVLEVVAT
jgi:hypothetical protein